MVPPLVIRRHLFPVHLLFPASASKLLAAASSSALVHVLMMVQPEFGCQPRIEGIR